MIILILNIIFLKEFLACNNCFGLFSKIKKGSGTSFLCAFSTWLFHKNVSYLILYQWTNFQCHTFFSSEDIKQNVLLSSYFDSWWRHKFWSTSKATVDGEKKREDGNIKNWISWEGNNLFRWNKNTLNGLANCKKTTTHHAHLSLCAKSRKANDAKVEKMAENLQIVIFSEK